MNFSHYQNSIFEFVKSGRGDGIVNAVAGAGKTTTLVECAKLINSNDALFVAFNKHVVEELSTRLKNTQVEAKTMHSIGISALNGVKRTKLNNFKYKDIIQDKLDNTKSKMSKSVKYDFVDSVASVVHFAQVTLTDYNSHDALLQMIDYYDIDLPIGLEELTLDFVKFAIEEGIKKFNESGEISFDDMIYLPVKLNLKLKVYSWLLVDEIQDLSKCQFELLKLCRAKGGRILMVGDPHQSIYGFAGSNPESFHQIRDELSATELPLSITYRCGTSIVKLAKTIVPQICAKDDAPTGEVIEISEEGLIDEVEVGDMVICRFTAPLVGLCLRLIGSKVPARVKGRDIGFSLVSIIKNVAKEKNFKFDKFLKFLHKHVHDKIAEHSKRKNYESYANSMLDKRDAIEICYANFNCKSINEFTNEISSIFSDEKASVTLSTIHKAKGMEANRVFIVDYDIMPLKWKGQLDWQLHQEECCQYIAITRAKSQLFLVG